MEDKSIETPESKALKKRGEAREEPEKTGQ